MKRSWPTSRGGMLIWLGVLGTACSLFAGAAGLGYFRLAGIAREAIALWRKLTEGFWRLAFGWIGLQLPETVAALASFLAFALAIALGVRLRTWRQAGAAGHAHGPHPLPASAARIAVGTVMALLAVPIAVICSELAAYLFPGLIAYLEPAMLAGALLPAFACFLWIHGARPHFAAIAGLGATYSACSFALPMSAAVDREILLFDLGPLLWLLAVPAVVVAVFSVMLRIAEPIALRNRLAMSTLVALAMLGANAGLAALRL